MKVMLLAGLSYKPSSNTDLCRPLRKHYTPRPRATKPIRRWQRAEDVCGGSLPVDIVLTLPSYHFSIRYLRSMALCSKTLLQAARDERNWSNAVIDATGAEFQSTPSLRQAARLWSLARHVILTIPQVAAHVPDNALIEWAGWTSQRPRHAMDRVHAWESQILLGAAQFLLLIPMFTQVLYIGVQTPNSNRRAFCKLTWPFTNRMTVDVGLNGGPPVRRTSPLQNFRAGFVHHFAMQWNPRWLSVDMDGQQLFFATVPDGVPDAPPLQAKLFVWAITVPYPLLRSPMILQPLPTEMANSPTVRCCLCGYQGLAHRPGWGVCTLCQNWACSVHIRRNPMQRCPTCVLPLQDYMAGKTLEVSSAEQLAELLDMDDFLWHPRPHRMHQIAWPLLDGQTLAAVTATYLGACNSLCCCWCCFLDLPFRFPVCSCSSASVS